MFRCNLKRISHIQKLFFPFSARQEKFMKPEFRDVTNLQSTQESLKEMHQEFINHDVEKALLSKSTTQSNTKKFSLRFVPRKDKLNKVLRKNLMQEIDKSHEKFYREFQPGDIRQLKSSYDENRRKIEEIKIFNKNFFEKNEVIRILRKLSLQAECFLPLNKVDDKNALELRKKYVEYKDSLNKLKNFKIEKTFTNYSENKKLALLLQSGILDNQKNLKQVVNTAYNILKKNQNSAEDENKSQKNLIVNPQNGKEVDFSNNIEANKELYVDLIKNMNLTLEKDLDKYDFEKLALFFNEVIKSNKVEVETLFQNLYLIEKIKDFEKYLFEHYALDILSVRNNKKLEFKHLTEQENINYVKYNTKDVKEIFLMYDSCKEVYTPKIISCMIQKVSTFKLPQANSILYVINDKRYRSILRYFLNTMNLLKNEEFVSAVWALGKIHRKEMGIIYPKLFLKIKERIALEIEERIEKFNPEERSFLCRALLNLNIALSNKMRYTIIASIEKDILLTQNIYSILGFLSYLSADDSDEANLLIKSSVAVINTEQVKNKLEKEDLLELCYVYSKFLNEKYEDKDFKIALKNLSIGLEEKLMLHQDKFNIDEGSSVLLFLAKNECDNNKLIISMRKNLLVNLKNYERYHDHSLAKSSTALALYDIKKKFPLFSLNLKEWVLKRALFPRLFFDFKSPQYIPYAEIAKSIESFKGNMKTNWIISTLFSLVSVNYINYDFYHNTLDYLLNQRVKAITDELKISVLMIAAMMNIDVDILKLLEEILDNYEKRPHKMNSNSAFNLVHLLNLLPCTPKQENLIKKLKRTKYLMCIQKKITYLSSESGMILLWNLVSLNVFDDQFFLQVLPRIQIPSQNQDLKNYLILNQIYNYLKNTGIFEKINSNLIDQWKNCLSREKIKRSYQNLDTDLEELSNQRGQRRPSRVIKGEIFETLTKVMKITQDFFTDSLIKINIVFNDQTLKGIRFYEEDYFNIIEKEMCLRTYFMNEIELLENEGWSIMCIRFADYEKVGKDALNIEEEKEQKREYLMKEVGSFLEEKKHK